MKKQEHKPVSTLKLNLKSSEDKSKTPQRPESDSLPKYQQELDEGKLQLMRQEWHQVIISRKKQEEVRIREQFGPSSSDEDDIAGSESPSEEEQPKSPTKEQEHHFRESMKLKDSRKATKQLDCQIYFSPKKGKEVWSKQFISFEDQSIMISQRPYYLKEIHKIKIIQGKVISDCNKIKLSCIDGSQVFLAANNQPYRDLPLNYYIFAYIVQQKLTNMGKKLFKCQLPNLPGIPGSLSKNSYNYGKIYKKSSLFGIWEERLIVINKEGIYAYKKFNEKHSMFLNADNLKQIWTRFEVEDQFLVIKILHGSSKTEFGVPLTELLDRRCWLFSFYSLAFPK